VPPRFSRFAWPHWLVAACCFVVALVGAARSARAAGGCADLVYSFQPDCYQPNGDGKCGQTLAHLDLGPQIAVWIETADHTLVDTMMVTSLTATRGIGNRPGIWNFRSGPKFPYGKRWMSLPVWAYARGKLFDSAFMQDDSPQNPRETWMGFHEQVSSRETYFCRPVTPTEINLGVDVVTCPSQNFNSAKGRLQATKSYYPPRNDLTSFTNSDCDNPGGTLTTCHVSAATYAALNDLDAIATATPPYGAPYTRTWHIPPTLPAGNYNIVVEVNKEFDTNASHNYAAFQDPNLPQYGVDGNFGQPSVLYRVPVHIGATTATDAVVSQIVGYSKWAGDSPIDGTILSRDETISTTVPGSGEMRLLSFDGPGGNGRVHVSLSRCPVCDGGCPEAGIPPTDDGSAPEAGSDGGVIDASVDAPVVEIGQPPGLCSPLPAPPNEVSSLAVTNIDATSATITFVNADAAGGMVDGYEVRYRIGSFASDAEFEAGDPGPFVQPGTPGAAGTLTVSNLKPGLTYVVGIRSLDACAQQSGVATVSFLTPAQKFTQLSGCFVATAAYGSALEPEVAALRRARDRLRAASPLFATAAELYYRSGPAAAAVVGESSLAKGVARRVIGPLAGLAEALDAASGRLSDHTPAQTASRR
jgi:hypothetical protein